ncbi:MAG: hypothetical protein ACI30R_03825 [Sodaliphilus sp.]
MADGLRLTANSFSAGAFFFGEADFFVRFMPQKKGQKVMRDDDFVIFNKNLSHQFM